MTILSENMRADIPLFALIMVSVICGVILFMILAGVEGAGVLASALIALGTSLVIFSVFFFSGETEKKLEVKAIITDESGYQELLENWKIKKTDGMIYILEERNE